MGRKKQAGAFNDVSCPCVDFNQTQMSRTIISHPSWFLFPFIMPWDIVNKCTFPTPELEALIGPLKASV